MELISIYKGTKLYQISEAKKGDKEPIQLPNSYNGIAILYENTAAKELPDELIGFLEKILELGLKVNPAECMLINRCYATISIQQLAETMGTKKLVLFGMDWATEQNNMKWVKNKVVKLYGIKVLPTDKLAVIQSNEESKKQFWLQLKEI